MTPDRIGKYEIVGTLGQGAMGEVYRARDTVLNREVALKRIAAGVAADETVRRRFHREAQSVAMLSHPNVITVYELGMSGDQPYMVMELLEGQSLKQALAQRTLRTEQKLDVVEQTLEGLAYAHRRGVVHRDLKPANIHLSGHPGRPRVKLVDFGLARVSGSDMTTTGTIMGTPHYMSPEQVRGQRADARSDVFAMGAVLYEVLCGRKPFDAESMHAVLFKVIQDDPLPLAEAAPDTPPALAQVVEKALAKDPAARFVDAGQMLQALRRARQAIAAGRGDERPAEFEPTIVVQAPAAAAASVAPPSAPPSAPAAASSFAARPPEGQAGRRHGLLLGVAGGVLLAALGVWALSSFGLTRRAAPQRAPEAQSLAQAVIDSQVEVASRRLAAGQLSDAVLQAERALKLDPGSVAAQRILTEARAAQAHAEAALSKLRAAGSDRAARAAAAFELMRWDPARPEADEAAVSAGAAFAVHAREARRLAQQARAAAERRGAGRSRAFVDGVALERRGELELEDGNPPAATRRFFEAQRAFERASDEPGA